MNNFESYISLMRSGVKEVWSVQKLRETSSWEQIVHKAPRLPKGWYELMGLSTEDRIDLCCEFWCNALGIQNKESSSICRFFSNLEDLQVYIFRMHAQIAYEVKMAYISSDETSCFYGSPPLLPFKGLHFPQLGDDIYYRFFSIHDGFGGCNDEGILPYKRLAKVEHWVRQRLSDTCQGSLPVMNFFPFYGSEDIFSYQCFICDPEFQRGEPSPNVLCNEYLLKKSFKKFIDLLHLTSTRYPSFLSWLESYIQTQEK